VWVDLMIWGEMVHDATRMPDQCYKEGVIGKGGVDNTYECSGSSRPGN